MVRSPTDQNANKLTPHCEIACFARTLTETRALAYYTLKRV